MKIEIPVYRNLDLILYGALLMPSFRNRNLDTKPEQSVKKSFVDFVNINIL